MADEPTPESQSPLKRRIDRRTMVGSTLAAASVAVAYAALGDKLGLFSGDGISSVISPEARGDTDAIKNESVQVSHLLRRVGFGVTREEHDRYQTLGLEKTLDEVIKYTSVDDSAALALAGQIDLAPDNRAAPILWWTIRMANTKRPLQEKLTVFWHGLLTSQISVVRDPTAMVPQNEFFRSHATAPFPEILRGLWRDPAMMVYLDMDGSTRRSPNENFARELMELYSLGEGNYTETDVREASRVFTGWRVPRNRIDQNTFTLQAPVFQQQAFDAGPKTFLGQTGNFAPDDIVNIIVQQPATAPYIVGKLFSFFVFPEPSEQDIAPFIKVYNDSGHDVGATVEAMLRSDIFFSPRAYRALVKSPLEYAIGALKALELNTSIAQTLVQPGGGGLNRGAGVLGEMGQIPFEPPNVAGWPGGIHWLNSATIFARLNYLNTVTGGGSILQPTVPSARTPQQQQRQQQANRQQPQQNVQPQIGNFGTAAQALDHFLPLALDSNLPDGARDVFLDYAGGADKQLDAGQLRGLVYLILGSPQFHLA